MGNCWAERSSVMNFILGATGSFSVEEPDFCIRIQQHVEEKVIVLINTPDLLHPDISEDKLRKVREECVEFSDPGPHVFLLVIRPEDFTEQHKQRLETILEFFGERSFHHSLVLISANREKGSDSIQNYEQHPLVGDMIRKCRRVLLWQKNLEHTELLMSMEQIVKENDGDHVSIDVFEDAPSELPSSHGSLNQGSWDHVRAVGRFRNKFYVINTNKL